MSRFRPEILAPAGNLFKLKTAIRYGADAVYFAGQRFGLRSAAHNFSLADIREGCRFARANNAKTYIVLNGFLFDEELESLPSFLKEVERAGVDAAIVSDLGVLETVRRCSSIPIHLSTQASTCNTFAAVFWRELGVKRIILGREVSIEEAAAIKRKTGIEVELFIHGAMCMAFSGHCTISNYTAGRDSNRGGCVQSCRFNYRFADQPELELGAILSSKDLNGIEHMARFLDMGIDSLKIEGRMKSPLYVATTVRAYARARDVLLAEAPRSAVAADASGELHAMSHRPYTDGSLVRKAGPESVARLFQAEDRHSHEMLGHIVAANENGIAVHLKNPLEAGEPATLLTPGGENLTIGTDSPRDLMGRPLRKAHPNRVVWLDAHPKRPKI